MEGQDLRRTPVPNTSKKGYIQGLKTPENA